MYLKLTQELEALRSQIQSQSVELNQMYTEKKELLRRADAGVNIQQNLTIPVKDVMFGELTCLASFPSVIGSREWRLIGRRQNG